jgi:hypothetical protein
MFGKKRRDGERRRSISYSLSECVIRQIDEVDSTSPRSVVVEQLLIEALKLRKKADVAVVFPLSHEELSWIAKLCKRGQTPEEYFRGYVWSLVEKAEALSKLKVSDDD